MKDAVRLVLRLSVVVVLTVGLLMATVPAASAACHAFTVEADPPEPAEGETVTLTIRRDADVQPSSVRVQTVDETATGGEDYTELDERVEFTEGTEEQREVDILDDDAAEDTETFVVELSEGEGCEVNPNFSYDSVTVSIEDDDLAAEQPPSPAPAPDEGEPEEEPQPAVQDTPETGTAQETPETGGGAVAGLGIVGVLAAAVLRRFTGSR